MLQEDHTAIVTDLSRMPEPENEAEEEYQRIIQDLYEQKVDLESKDGFPARRWRIIMECGSIRLKPLLLPCV